MVELLFKCLKAAFVKRIVFRVPAFDTSQLNSMVTQVHEMFPQLAMESILQDLRESGSAQATIENILEGRLDEYNASITFEHSFQVYCFFFLGGGGLFFEP